MGTGAVSLGVKRSKRQADYSPPPNAEVKYEWGCTSSHPISIHGPHRDNITLTWGQITEFVVLLEMVRRAATEFKGLKRFSQSLL